MELQLDRKALVALGAVVVAIAVVVWWQVQGGMGPKSDVAREGREIAGAPPGVRAVEFDVQQAPMRLREGDAEEAVPAGAAKLDPGEYAMRGGAQAGPRAEVSELACASNVLVRAKTGEGTFLIGIGPSAPWDCAGTISRWQAAQGGASRLGLRYDGPKGDGPPFVTLVGERSSVAIAATGLWRLP